ncbi:HlyD family efflux transporter periplasmic adaptor subunit [Zoogloea sp.]|uniref:efflux RND transporter periplasmic adaptor subunit n=1 Tax=Zoogloea sp. TaxID=49181 RepID=UPI00258B56B2|nr:HlyD family efflux transporter periplasmic adaptor subunit [Zoogloea sp.]MDD2667067.1 HlyD family efflux transporter periplasmic adaptor subunit [Zoogloea sp.]
MLAAVMVLLAVPFEFRVGGNARVEGEIQRVLVAPADGFLKQALVRPGDLVKAGQLLAELAEQDLQLERSKWSSELAQHENAYSAAMARADRTQLVISQAKADEARAQLALVDGQIGRSHIVAPFDGVLIRGDLTQSLGAPVQRGDVLLTVAPRERFRVIVEVDNGILRGSGSVSRAVWPFRPCHGTPCP